MAQDVYMGRQAVDSQAAVALEAALNGGSVLGGGPADEPARQEGSASLGDTLAGPLTSCWDE
jgi:hypothetical protein